MTSGMCIFSIIAFTSSTDTLLPVWVKICHTIENLYFLLLLKKHIPIFLIQNTLMSIWRTFYIFI